MSQTIVRVSYSCGGRRGLILGVSYPDGSCQPQRLNGAIPEGADYGREEVLKCLTEKADVLE